MKTVYTLIGVCGFLAILLMMSLTTRCFGAPLVDMYGTPVPQGGRTDIGVHETIVLAQADLYDANTKTIKIDTSKQVTLTGLAEKAPIKIDGKLDKEKPQIAKADSGMAIRVRYMTDKPIMKTVEDKDGKITETPSGDYYWAMVDGIGVELYDGKFVITYKSGTKEEITTKNYKFYQIKEEK